MVCTFPQSTVIIVSVPASGIEDAMDTLSRTMLGVERPRVIVIEIDLVVCLLNELLPFMPFAADLSLGA